MFAPKWAREPHNLACFPSWDPYITPGYWAWYLNVLPTSESLFRSLFYAFMPREGIYTCVFAPPPPLSDENPVMLHFFAYAEIIFAHILVFPACAIEVQHINENSPTIFIDMFAPKWARGPHNLAHFPSWDPCITPGYWVWYLNVLPTSGSLFKTLFYAFMPWEGIYTCVFFPDPPPFFPQRRKPSYAALLCIRGNYFRSHLSISRVCHKGAAYQWKFSYKFDTPVNALIK